MGAKWTRSSSYPVIYFSFLVWQVTLLSVLSFPKGLQTKLDMAHTVASFIQMGLILLQHVQWLLVIAQISPLWRILPLPGESGDWCLLPRGLWIFSPHWIDVLVALNKLLTSTMLSVKDAIWRFCSCLSHNHQVVLDISVTKPTWPAACWSRVTLPAVWIHCCCSVLCYRHVWNVAFAQQ